MALFDDSRADWGARKPKNAPTSVAASRRTEFFVHYDGGAPVNVASHADCLTRVRQDQAYHMDSNGWSDIGYNGLVCQHGRAIEGRGIDYVGAHCPDHNTSGYGFQFMVGGSQAPTGVAKARMARLYADCAARSGHTLAKKGHRDGFATACPGDLVYAWVKAGMPAPTSTAQTITPKEFEVADAKDAAVLWTTPLTTKGTLGQLDAGESPLAILSRIGRNLEALIALEKAEASAATVAAAVVAALPKGQTATAHDIAAEIIAQLTPKES